MEKNNLKFWSVSAWELEESFLKQSDRKSFHKNAFTNNSLHLFSTLATRNTKWNIVSVQALLFSSKTPFCVSSSSEKWFHGLRVPNAVPILCLKSEAGAELCYKSLINIGSDVFPVMQRLTSPTKPSMCMLQFSPWSRPSFVARAPHWCCRARGQMDKIGKT